MARSRRNRNDVSRRTSDGVVIVAAIDALPPVPVRTTLRSGAARLPPSTLVAPLPTTTWYSVSARQWPAGRSVARVFVESHSRRYAVGGSTRRAAATEWWSIGRSKVTVNGAAGSWAVPIGTNRSAETSAGVVAGIAVPGDGVATVMRRAIVAAMPVTPPTRSTRLRAISVPTSSPSAMGAASSTAPGFRNTSSSRCDAGCHVASRGRHRRSIGGSVPDGRNGREDTTRVGSEPLRLGARRPAACHAARRVVTRTRAFVPPAASGPEARYRP